MNRLLPIANIIGLIAVITVNALAVLLPIAGKTTEELSDMYPNLFVPAGITFSIWSVIYLALICFGVYQAQGLLPSKSENPPAVERIGWLFVLSCVLNCSWIIAWHYQYVGLSVVIMLAFLATLISIYTKEHIAVRQVSRNEKLFVFIPFSLYLGWISIATIANITTFLVDIDWAGFGQSETFWAVIMIGIGTLLTLFILLNRNDLIYALVVIWAYVGIILKQSGNNQTVVTAAGICIALIVVTLITRVKKWAQV